MSSPPVKEPITESSRLFLYSTAQVSTTDLRHYLSHLNKLFLRFFPTDLGLNNLYALVYTSFYTSYYLSSSLAEIVILYLYFEHGHCR